ncbi:NAD(P)-binding protein [Leucogyrophana mollusca]|uniref:NAD(P)-binding protein n=1 Tax=Leucogyrophana mollusca TaxID=85980 RepID=A0ACB8AZE5_9AGAM|nr:NAD(P)-binding protein [Leucogyrophana mollusca]
MPALPTPPAGQKVLVSGANGFVAIWVVRALLERGYAVRSSVRAAVKGRHLEAVFAQYGDQHEVVVVPDITAPGAFDEAVKGVDAIQHIASPVPVYADGENMITPAVNGTLGMLQSAMKHGDALKRVVVTSSVAAVLHIGPEPQEFDEHDWNEQCLEVLARGDADPSVTTLVKYLASKTLAEKAVWKFWEDNRGRIEWDIVALNPPYVRSQPVMHDIATPSALGASMSEWFTNVAKIGATDEFLASAGGGYIDVRDLADAHALALEKQAAGSKRIIVCAGAFKWQDFLDAANTISPPLKLSTPLPVGVPGAGSASPGAVHMFTYKTDRAAEVLGLKYRSLTDTTRDILTDYEARGW